ncbi:hypothetical protein ACQKJZ_04435 [Sphingomonas sp. NPDC019816]|jgi:molecular chaperone GrpE (heat shock protein)|uniref:hypothetical protein n=1 Tax=Sphingomonas sp. NPDC019816 TaxID=3390679 RepID=UPI003D0932F7
MKKTNYQPGPRGINLASGGTYWVEPGQSVTITAKDKDGAQHIETEGGDKIEIKGDIPDFGRKVDAEADAAASDRVEALTAENADLKAQVAALQADLEKATKPAK